MRPLDKADMPVHQTKITEMVELISYLVLVVGRDRLSLRRECVQSSMGTIGALGKGQREREVYLFLGTIKSEK